MVFLNTPKFWDNKPSFIQKTLLKPVSSIYRAISNYRYDLPYDVTLNDKKVIAVGGITMGGSGKTVVVSSICKILKEHNKKFAVLSRGYGRMFSKPLKVDKDVHTYKDVGDEPLMLANQFDVFVGKNRAETAEMAADYEYLVLDDGLTQRYLEPTKKILVIDELQGFGNGEIFPLGPNRLDYEKIKLDLDGIVLLGDRDDGVDFKTSGIPVYYGKREQDFRGISGRLIVFCGLGYPKKFFYKFANYEVAKTMAFPDHYPYKDNDIKLMLSEAFRLGAQLVTTEKDLMRIPQRYWSHIKTVGVNVSWVSSLNSLLDI